MTEPLGIRRELMKIVRRLGVEHPDETALLFSQWEELVGPMVSGRCEPVSLKDGVLTVKAQLPVWAAELRYLSPELIRRANEQLGKPLIREVKITSGRPSKGPIHGRRPGPPSRR